MKFLARKLARVALGLASLLTCVLPLHGVRAEEDLVRLEFAAGPDDTNTVQRIVESFNETYAGKIRVALRVMPRDNDVHRRQLVETLSSGADEPHVFASDVVWTAELAQSGHVKDLTRRFYDSYQTGEWLEPARASASFRLRVWGVPWYSDVSLLFYRKDLLAQSGFDGPPRTWDELRTMAKKVMTDSGTRHGFVFQGADYEGGAANAFEFMWSAGGRVVTVRLATDVLGRSVAELPDLEVETPQAARGLDTARQLIEDGVTPAEVTRFRERESLRVFLRGDAVFLRSWPYVVGMVERSQLRAEQLGIARLPGVTAKTSRSCLGGWNLMTNIRNDAAEQQAAWTFIRFLTSVEVQRTQAVNAGLLPVRVALYDDARIVSAVPALALSRDTLAHRTRARPSTPVYSQLSGHVSSVFQRVLKGELTGAQAVAILDDELQKIIVANR